MQGVLDAAQVDGAGVHASQGTSCAHIGRLRGCCAGHALYKGGKGVVGGLTALCRFQEQRRVFHVHFVMLPEVCFGFTKRATVLKYLLEALLAEENI